MVYFILFVCFGDQVFSLGFVPSSLLNSPEAILKLTAPLPVSSQEKKEEGKKNQNILEKFGGRVFTRLETIFRHSIGYLICSFLAFFIPLKFRSFVAFLFGSNSAHFLQFIFRSNSAHFLHFFRSFLGLG